MTRFGKVAWLLLLAFSACARQAVPTAASGDPPQLAALPPRPEAQPETAASEARCLAQAIYFEARGESVDGQAAVASVVLNRVKDPDFPNTICGVVRQRNEAGCQFSWTCDGRSDKPTDPAAWAAAQQLAADMIAGKRADSTHGALYFSRRDATPDWARKMTRTAAIGEHLYYR